MLLGAAGTEASPLPAAVGAEECLLPAVAERCLLLAADGTEVSPLPAAAAADAEDEGCPLLGAEATPLPAAAGCPLPAAAADAECLLLAAAGIEASLLPAAAAAAAAAAEGCPLPAAAGYTIVIMAIYKYQKLIDDRPQEECTGVLVTN